MDGLAVEQYTRTPPLASTESHMATLPTQPSPREPSEKQELPHHPMLSTAALLNPIVEKAPTPPPVEEPVPLHLHSLPHSRAHSHAHSHSHSPSPVENGASATTTTTTTPPRELANGTAVDDAPE
ncbi:hypothetical protein Trco_004368 [Trichoderma cornu-damae]|uniref:Uncharacterized protein n=1 Tax=Trichoderma cornu-damae TaxID=654480 RepID=A0A9P8QQW5_9HYPO|nr:hypothetical protein Trco_004368 [Trichoderma cornu-damae]